MTQSDINYLKLIECANFKWSKATWLKNRAVNFVVVVIFKYRILHGKLL